MTHVVINQKFLAVGGGDAARAASEAVLKTAEMFGIGLDETCEVTVYDSLALDVRPGDVVFVTGPSGSGKSVLLGRLQEALAAAAPGGVATVNLAEIVPAADRTVIDLLGGPLQERLRILSAAGLADAFLLLRRPHELSDGQRWRLRLALAIQQCGMRSAECGVTEKHQQPRRQPNHDGGADDGGVSLHTLPRSVLHAPRWSLLVADEFCSTLDRLCARAVAYRVRRLADATGVTILAASAHDDLVEDLAPDVLVVKHEARRVDVRYADPQRNAKCGTRLPDGQVRSAE